MKYEKGQFVQQKRKNWQTNAWRCAGVVTSFHGADTHVAWLEFDRTAYQLTWPRPGILDHAIPTNTLLPLCPKKSVVPIADSVHAEVMKMLLS